MDYLKVTLYLAVGAILGFFYYYDQKKLDRPEPLWLCIAGWSCMWVLLVPIGIVGAVWERYTDPFDLTSGMRSSNVRKLMVVVAAAKAHEESGVCLTVDCDICRAVHTYKQTYRVVS